MNEYIIYLVKCFLWGAGAGYCIRNAWKTIQNAPGEEKEDI